MTWEPEARTRREGEGEGAQQNLFDAASLVQNSNVTTKWVI